MLLRSTSIYWCASLIVIFGLLASSAGAGQLVNVYRAEALVKTQSEAERNAAARETLGSVIVRVSGQRSALEHPAVQQAISNAQNYLFGFTYQSSSQKITDNGKVFPAVSLQLNYSPEAIEQLLRQSQLPLWPAQRPKVLVWLVAKDQTGLHLVPEPSALAAMQAQAAYRGLPVIMPKMDLEDSLSLSGDDLWALDLEKIRAASIRYKVDAILVGRYTPYSMGPIPPRVDPNAESQIAPLDVPPEELAINQPPVAEIPTDDVVTDSALVAEQPQGPWIGDWQLIQGDNLQTFADETPEVAGLFESAIDHSADYFASQYAITPSNQGPQTIVLSVTNITSFGAFKRVQAYLDELAMVRRMELMRVNSDGLLISLTVEGDVRLLMSTLALAKKLTPIASESLPELQAAEVQAESPTAINASVDTLNPVISELDPGVAAELDAPASVEQAAGLQTVPAPAATPMHAGTREDPLLYVWQAK